MTQLSNPFTPFLTALESGDQGHAVVHGAAHETLGTIHTLGTSQYLQDEIGRHIGTIDHLTHSSAALHDASGAATGSAHTTGDTTVLHDKFGSAEAYIHHGPGGHDTITDAHHTPIGTIDHQGHLDVYHDAGHGISQTVSHE